MTVDPNVVEKLHRAIQNTAMLSPSETLLLFARAKQEIERMRYALEAITGSSTLEEAVDTAWHAIRRSENT